MDELRRLLGPRLVTDPDIAGAYQRDQCALVASRVPRAVVRARSVEDVCVALDYASRHGIGVVPRGAGTGLSGGANVVDDSIVLSLEAMDRIISVDPVSRLAHVQAGVLNGRLDQEARRHGLFYAPDPGSRAISTIGGNIATNAGGMCCAKYGVTADHVRELTAVLADGAVVRTGTATRKDVAGYDLTRLLVGSEGTLAVVVEARLALQPLPTSRCTVVATFDSVSAAVASSLSTISTPAAMELMDRATVEAINQLTRAGLPPAAATVIAEFDSDAAESEASSYRRAAESHGALEVTATTDDDVGAAMMEARRLAFPALERLGSTVLDDVCVPVHLLPELVTAVERIGRESGLRIGTFGHLADGNLHPTIVYDRDDPRQAAQARRAFESILSEALRLGGTVTGEHGIGRLKQSWLPRQHDLVALRLMSSVKSAFDPQGILNPGKAITSTPAGGTHEAH